MGTSVVLLLVGTFNTDLKYRPRLCRGRISEGNERPVLDTLPVMVWNPKGSIFDSLYAWLIRSSCCLRGLSRHAAGIFSIWTDTCKSCCRRAFNHFR